MRVIYKKGKDFRRFVIFLILLALFIWFCETVSVEVKFKKKIPLKDIKQTISVNDFDKSIEIVNGFND
jgi:hypothetical protein